MAVKEKSATWMLKRLNLPNGLTYPLNDSGVTKIGRHPQNDICCPSLKVSRDHCEILIDKENNMLYITDSVMLK